MPHRLTRPIPALAVALCALALPPGASAATYGVAANQLTYTAAPGEHNDVRVYSGSASDLGSYFELVDHAPSGCESSADFGDPRSFGCYEFDPSPSREWNVSVDLGDGADNAQFFSAGIASRTIDTGAGDDTVAIVPHGGTTLRTGAGDDIVRVAYAAPGAIRPGQAATIDCGPGTADTVYYEYPAPPQMTGCEFTHQVSDAWEHRLFLTVTGGRDWEGTLFAGGSTVTATADTDGHAIAGALQIRTDDGDWQPYTPGMTLPAGGDGTHDVYVRAQRPGGGWWWIGDGSWIADHAIALPVLADVHDDAWEDENGGVVRGTVVNLKADPNLESLEYRLDGGPLATVVERRQLEPVASLTFANLVPGRHTLQVRQTDLVGNVSEWATLTWGQDPPVSDPPPPPQPPAAPPAAPAAPLPAAVKAPAKPVKPVRGKVSLPLTCASTAGCAAGTYTLTFKVGKTTHKTKATVKALAAKKTGALVFKLTSKQAKALRRRTVTATVTVPGHQGVRVKLRG
jgi:uncharacterized protein YaiE (UPF0345 family)